MLEKLQALYSCGCCDDTATLATIKDKFNKYGYLLDTHTAVAVKVYDEYVALTGDKTPTVIASTASPYKFSASVLKAVDETKCGNDEFKMVDALMSVTKTDAPAPIKALKGATPRFNNVCEKTEMIDVVLNFLKIK